MHSYFKSTHPNFHNVVLVSWYGFLGIAKMSPIQWLILHNLKADENVDWLCSMSRRRLLNILVLVTKQNKAYCKFVKLTLCAHMYFSRCLHKEQLNFRIFHIIWLSTPSNKVAMKSFNLIIRHRKHYSLRQSTITRILLLVMVKVSMSCTYSKKMQIFASLVCYECNTDVSKVVLTRI